MRSEELSGGFKKKRTKVPKAKARPRARARRTVSSKETELQRRLTDTGSYTGTHKHRFDKHGKGKGLAGRDSIAKGGSHVDADGIADYYVHTIYQRDAVHDLSVITPSNVVAPRTRSKACKGKTGSPRRRSDSPIAASEDIELPEADVGVPSIFLKLTDEERYTGTFRKTFPTKDESEMSDDSDAWSGIASGSDQPGPWDVSSMTSSTVAAHHAGRGVTRGSAAEGGTPAASGAPHSRIAREEKAAFRRASHEKKKEERRVIRESEAIQARALAGIFLDATEKHGDDVVSLLLMVRQQAAGMAALTQANLGLAGDDLVSDQLFDVKTDYIKKKKSVCLRISADGIDFLDSRATMVLLATLSFSAIESWALTKSGRLSLTLESSVKPVTIVSKYAETIIDTLNSHAGIAADPSDDDEDADGGVKVQQAAAGATISFSRRFKEDVHTGVMDGGHPWVGDAQQHCYTYQ